MPFTTRRCSSEVAGRGEFKERSWPTLAKVRPIKPCVAFLPSRYWSPSPSIRNADVRNTLTRAIGSELQPETCDQAEAVLCRSSSYLSGKRSPRKAAQEQIVWEADCLSSKVSCSRPFSRDILTRSPHQSVQLSKSSSRCKAVGYKSFGPALEMVMTSHTMQR